MATRNLTKKYLEHRNAAKANRGHNHPFDEGDKSLLKGSDSSSNALTLKAGLPPVWVEKIEQVEEDISKIQTKMGEMDALHRKRLKVNFESDEAQQEFEIEAKTREITETFHHAETLLKRFGKQSEQDPSISPDERKVRKNMQMAMAKKLQSLSLSFRSQQKKYLESLQLHKKGGSQAFDFLLEENQNKKPAGADFIDQGFSKDQLQLLEDTEMVIDQRHEEIVKIAKSIEELAQIFRELAVLVIDQGTILDRIDYNMDQAVSFADQGLEKIKEAEVHQKNSMSVKCIILLVILIAIMIGILAWKHSSSSNSK